MEQRNRNQENINISVPKNLFLLLVVGILIIAGILAYQFVLSPAKEAALEKAAEIKAEQRLQQQANEAIISAKKDPEFIFLLAVQKLNSNPEPFYYLPKDGLKGLKQEKAQLARYNAFDGSKLILALRSDMGTNGKHKLTNFAIFMIKKGGKWRIIRPPKR